MSVVSVSARFLDRGGETDAYATSLSVSYLVECSNEYDGPITVLSAAGLPAIGAAWVEGTTTYDHLRCKKRSCAPLAGEHDPLHWVVTCAYDTKAFEPKNPLDRPAKYSISWAQHEEIVERDIIGQLVRNSAGAPFDPPLTRDKSRPVLKCQRNEALTFAELAAKAAAWQDAVNDAEYFGLAAGYIKVAGITGESAEEDGVAYFAVSYELHVNWEGWQAEVLDAGFYDLTGGFSSSSGTHRKKVITDRSGNPINTVSPLDGEGKRLDPGADPVFLSFGLYREKDFTELGI